MSRRRNGTNRAMTQLGKNKYKLGKKKAACAGTQNGNQEKIHYHYNITTGKYQVEVER